jgi:predicted RNA-binding Zn-ribbon protein involved in translation (DUF1610 family)
MIAKCPKCGFKIEIGDEINNSRYFNFKCPKCGSQMISDAPTYDKRQQVTTTFNNSERRGPVNMPFEPQAPQSTPKQYVQDAPLAQQTQNVLPQHDTNDENTKHSSKALPIVLISIGVLAIIAVAIFVFYIPYLKDKNAPREYSIANATNLRTSKDAGGDYNKIRSLPFGSELKTYSKDGEWTEVKDADGEKGFMSSELLVSKTDFLLLNSIFGDQESRENIATIKCRKALLQYFKDHKYYGKLSQENLKLINPKATVNSTNQWQVFCKAKGIKPNSVFFARLMNMDSKFTDFAVLIKNINTNERKLLLFQFDDDGTPHFLTEQTAPEYGYIVNIYVDEYDNLNVQYSE